MCLICIEIAKGKLKSFEAVRILGEMVSTGHVDKEHQADVLEKVYEKMVEEAEQG